MANDGVRYTLITTISDNDGYNDIIDVRALFNFVEAGGDQSKGRGYFAWGTSDGEITRYGGAWTLGNATGGGRWGYPTDIWGGITYVTPVGCSVSTTGSATGGVGSRTVTWVFKAKPAWAMNPLINDADVWACDSSNQIIGWRENPGTGLGEFDVVSATCTSSSATPHPPVVANPTSSSLDVSVAPEDSDTDLFCIRISPAVWGKDFVQADGTLGGYSALQTKAAWGTKTVTGLASDTAYSFKVRAARSDPGCCPSDWGTPAGGRTAVLVRTIDYTKPGAPINKAIMGMNNLPWAISAQRRADDLAASVNTSIRFGGDGYNWKTRTAQWNSNTWSTLQALREARDRNSYLQILTNTRGIGTGNGSTWVYTDQTPETLAALTADWVFYCNELLQTKRQGDPLDAREQAVLDSMSWGTDQKLLSPGEALTPKVVYWEIGNEPEGPYPPPSLTPEDYAARYKIISQAVLAEDPTVKVGPCMMTADNGNAWLDAVLSDPTNRVDFINYHPYGPLYGITKTTSGGVLNADDLQRSLNVIKQQQTDRRQKVIDRLAANSRPTDTPLVPSENNASSWEGTYYFSLNRTAAHALGTTEMIFAFAQLGMLAAQYWDCPNCTDTSIEAPGFKVYKTMQSYMGDRLLEWFDERDFRLYTTLDTQTGRLIIWAINFSEYLDKSVRFQLPDTAPLLTIAQHRLAATSGATSLITMNKSNDATEKIAWSLTSLTGTLNPADFTLTFPHATLTMLRLDRPFMSLPDNTRVSMTGKSVTAVYPSEGYLYVEQDNRSYGLRVAGECAGIAVGDRVSITGNIGTLKPDGVTASERYTSAEAVTRISSGTPLKPVAVNCRWVGGGPSHGTVGVKDGYGASNIGLLVKIAGKVTAVVDDEYMYVDDGSEIADIGGRIGVLVRCPSTAAYSPGDLVMVTGVVEGSIPEGWTANRRFIRARTAEDIAPILQ